MGRRHRHKRKGKNRPIPTENQMVLENAETLAKDLTSYWRGSELVGMLDKSDSTLHVIGRFMKGRKDVLEVAGQTWTLGACGVYYKMRQTDAITALTSGDRRSPCVECLEAVRSGREGPLFNTKLQRIMIAASDKTVTPTMGAKQQSKKQRRTLASTFRLNSRPPGNWHYPGEKIIVVQTDFTPPFDYDTAKGPESKESK